MAKRSNKPVEVRSKVVFRSVLDGSGAERYFFFHMRDARLQPTGLTVAVHDRYHGQAISVANESLWDIQQTTLRKNMSGF